MSADAVITIGGNRIPVVLRNGPGPKGDPGSGENVTDTLDNLAAINTATGPEIVYVQEVDADYAFISGSSATADGWVVIAPDAGTGRWHLQSSDLYVAPLGASADDVPRLAAAAEALSGAGKSLRLGAETYTLDTVWEFPLGGILVETTPQTTLHQTLTPNGSPATAGLYAAPGSIAASTTIAAANGVSEYTVSSTASVAAGKFVRILDTDSGSGFHGSTYEVQSVSGAGPYTLTLDRPVLTQFGTGDEITVFNAIPQNIRITGGGRSTGTATRLFEFIGTAHCHSDLVLEPDEVEDVVGSYDVGGFDNHFTGRVIENGSGAIDGFFLETQESSSTEFAEVSGFADGVGISHFDCELCEDDSKVWGCDIGIAARGDGNETGCNDCSFNGVYNGNITQGIAVVNGSRGTKINGIAKFNPVNLAIGDGDGGNVEATVVNGDFASATSIGISIHPTALGTALGIVDTTDSPTGISTQAPIWVNHHIHRGAFGGAGNALLDDGGGAVVLSVDYNISTTGVNVVKSISDAQTRVLAGTIVAGANSNIFFADNTAKILIGAVTGTSSGASHGGYANHVNATIEFWRGADFSGCAIKAGGPGSLIVPRASLSRQIGPVGTTAVTTEETLKTYTIPANTMKPGQKLIIVAWGTTANNANSKTLRVEFGGTNILFQNQGQNIGWRTEIEVYSTGTGTQDYTLRHAAGSLHDAAAGALTKDETANIVVNVHAQNGTASANDLVCRGLEVIHASA